MSYLCQCAPLYYIRVMLLLHQALPIDHPVVQAYTADVAARQQLAQLSHGELIAAGATMHVTAAAAAAMHTTAAAAARQYSGGSSSSDADGNRKQEETAASASDKHVADGDSQQSRRSLKALRTQFTNMRQQQQQQQRQYKCGRWKFTLDESQGVTMVLAVCIQ